MSNAKAAWDQQGIAHSPRRPNHKLRSQTFGKSRNAINGHQSYLASSNLVVKVMHIFVTSFHLELAPSNSPKHSFELSTLVNNIVTWAFLPGD